MYDYCHHYPIIQSENPQFHKTIKHLSQSFRLGGLVELIELEVEVLPVLGQVHVVDRSYVRQHGPPETAATVGDKLSSFGGGIAQR